MEGNTARVGLRPGVELEIEQEVISYTTMHPYERDPDWDYTDHAGHPHDSSLATCTWYVTRTWWCSDCRDMHDEGEWRCLQCGEVIEPGQRYIGNGPHTQRGLVRGTLSEGGMRWHLMGEEMQGMPPAPYASDPPAWDAWMARVRSRPPDGAHLRLVG